MGSLITLSVGNLELDWGKNSTFTNHSRLFLPTDVETVPYFYADGDEQLREALVRSLASIKKRLELLGYSLGKSRLLYEQLAKEMAQHGASAPPFAVFADALRTANLADVPRPDEPPEWFDFGEYGSHVVGLAVFNQKHDLEPWHTKEAGYFFENLDPYVVLRLLLENPANLDRRLVWRYADVVEGGWINSHDVYEGLADRDRFLVITEGTSDTAVIRKAIEMLHSDIADFFYFIDVDTYPFSGSGGLYKFCQGLAAIRLQNQALAVFDNDSAGACDYERVRRLTLPSRFRAMLLPSLPDFTSFRCLGPAGATREDINRRGAAIECYLDLSGSDEPTVRWLSYDKLMDNYQGVLERKEAYTRRFLGLRHCDPTYDFSKLLILLECLYEECVRCAERIKAFCRA